MLFEPSEEQGAGAAMAIKFVDKEPEDEKPKKTEEPNAKPQAEHDTPEPISGDGEPALPGLTHAKPEPKPRGRKKPLK